MSGLLFLSSEDFFTVNGTKGNIMCHSIPGISLILFYSTQCEHCQKLIPIFKLLPGTLGGCQFGMINVSTNRECVKMSQNTIAPITYVPYIILFIGGKPFMKYQGPHDINEIKRFVFEVAQKMRTKQKFTDGGKIKIDKEGLKIPAYTIGHPLCGGDGDDVCYLTMEEAYQKPQSRP